MSNNPHWHILGAGSIGGLWACRMDKAGCDVTLVVRPDAASAYNGISIETPEGKLDCKPGITTATRIAKPVENLLITTKAHQTHKALLGIKKHCRPDCNIISLQNGMGLYELIKQAMPNASVFSAVTTDGVFRKEPFHLVQAGKGETFIGSLGENVRREEVNALVERLSQSNVQLQWDDLILQRLWFKLLINCVINPMTLIHNCHNRDILKPNHQKQLSSLCREVDEVMHAEGIYLQHPTLETVSRVAELTGDNISSMLADFRNGQDTEIDFLNGYLIATARKHGLEVLAHQKVYNQVIKLTGMASNG